MDFYDSNMWYLISIKIVILIIVLLSKFKNKRIRTLGNEMPGPKGSFLIGSLPLLLQGPEKILVDALTMYQTYEKCLFKMWIVNKLYIVLTQPKDIEFVLTHPELQKKGKEYIALQESVMGQGIFTNEDIKKWKNNRKMVTKGLSFSILKSFISIFYEEANVLSKILQENCESISKECDISIPVSMATMEMIGRTSLGIQLKAQTSSRHRFVENLRIVLHTWEYRITHPWYLSKTLFRLSKMNRRHSKSQKIINEFTDEIINEKFTELNRNATCEKRVETDDDDTHDKPKTIIEILLENYHEMSHEQIREEIVTIMIGGQDTTATTNACVLFMLSHHQEVQKKVFEELQSIFSMGNSHRSPTYDDLQQMYYLEQVIKETLRLFPPLPFITRSLEKELQIGDHLCPAGSTLVICPDFLHKSSQHYSDPEKFDPDNFLPDKCRKRHSYAYIPFSAGPRNCIGTKYAMLQMKTVVSTLLRKYKFSPSDRYPTTNHLKLMFLATLKFVDGCYVKIEPRT